ncbi:hypothetical protein [Sinomonas atrocyanea]|jgi:hypothetical protein|uniref:hypothetical protein n=1 Tax=Sinomonas atrocyanea TaxID=37927 RepID=UPI00285A4ABC|nr:hypothetical protein [Sinomonas atrocyanea]MDR6620273.1 hypothetical protein [Sinomonas atrocyanea]
MTAAGADDRAHGALGAGAVDTGALTTAIVAAGAAFFAQPGDWTFLSVVLGIAFLLVLLAYHRPREGAPTLQAVFVRAAFAGTVGLSLCIAAGAPLQLAAEGAGMPNAHHEAADAVTEWVSWAWVPVTLLVFWLEPRITRALVWSGPAPRADPSHNPDPDGV